MTKKTPKYLLWVDLEMTGLDPDSQRILEVAAIVTDWTLKPLSTYHAVVRQNPEVLAGADAWCKEQHGKSGLLAAVPKGKPEAVVEAELVELAQAHADPILLAGNSVYFDRRFIRRYWPDLEALLHYRMLDVSAWKVVMSGKYGIEFRKTEAHRALDDIKGSIEELEHYLKLAHFPSKQPK